MLQPYDMEMGAGTFHPATTLRALGPKPWRAAYVQPSRRPTDGRYGENPNRVQHYYQYQVIMKPSPENAQDLLLASYRELGLDPLHARFPLRGGRLGKPDARRLGARLGGVVRRHGGGAVHLFPAGRRHPGDAAELRDDLWPRTPGDVCAGQAEHLRPRLQRYRRHLWRRVPACRTRIQRVQFRTGGYRDADAAFRRRRTGMRRAAGARSWPCRPTTSASRPAICSTCSTPAG